MPNNRLPMYQRIEAELLNEIGRGDFIPGQSFITERELCTRFGVSRITAVRALNDLVQRGVLIRKRGRGTFVAGSGRVAPSPDGENSSRLIGCIFNELRGQHLLSVLRGVENACREAGCNILVFDSTNSPETEASNLQQAREAGVSGMVVYPVDGFENTAAFEDLRVRRVPLVLMDRYYPSVPTDVVVPDNIQAGHDLTQHLIERGHRYISTVWEESSVTSAQDRLTGYKQALREHGLPIVPELSALMSYVVLSESARRALLTTWLNAPYRPTAFIAANGYTLVQLGTDLLDLGVNLTEDVEIASMDSAGLYEMLGMAVATVDLPSYEMGAAAVRLLLDRLHNNPTAPLRHIILPVQISTRGSENFRLRMVAK